MIHPIQAATKSYIWGGTQLAERFGKHSEAESIAETWELSCHPDGPSFLSDRGETLVEYLEKNPERAGRALAKVEDFPMLVKLIDAKKNLSVQVHPDDAYALEHEGQLGKTEMWYVVDASDDAFIYLGFEEALSAEEFYRLVDQDQVVDKLKKVRVQAGDFYFIPAGTIHAIGAGCLIAEVQESSNVTYRVSDYGRTDKDGKPRQLHVEQAKRVTAPTVWEAKGFSPHLAKTDYFIVDLHEGAFDFNVGEDSFVHILHLGGGQALIKSVDEKFVSMPGQGHFIDAGTGDIEVLGEGLLMLTRLPEIK